MQTDADVEQASGGEEHGWAQLAYGKRWRRIRCRRRFKLITPMHMQKQQQQQQLVKEAAWQGTLVPLCQLFTRRHKQSRRQRKRTAKVVLCLEPKCCVLLQHVGATSAADLPQLNHINKGQQQQQWCFAKLLYQLDLGEVKCNYLLLNKLATILIPSIGSEEPGVSVSKQLTPALNSNNNCAAVG